MSFCMSMSMSMYKYVDLRMLRKMSCSADLTDEILYLLDCMRS